MCAIKVPQEQDKTSCLDQVVQLTLLIPYWLDSLMTTMMCVSCLFCYELTHNKSNSIASSWQSCIELKCCPSSGPAKTKLSIIYHHQIRKDHGKYCAFSTLFNVDLKKPPTSKSTPVHITVHITVHISTHDKCLNVFLSVENVFFPPGFARGIMSVKLRIQLPLNVSQIFWCKWSRFISLALSLFFPFVSRWMWVSEITIFQFINKVPWRE